MDLYDIFSQNSQTLAQSITLPTTDEFHDEIAQYEAQAIQYFSLIMGVTIIVTFIKTIAR